MGEEGDASGAPPLALEPLPGPVGVAGEEAEVVSAGRTTGVSEPGPCVDAVIRTSDRRLVGWRQASPKRERIANTTTITPMM
jgi:hypothetical protein